jgi:protein NEDD1
LKHTDRFSSLIRSFHYKVSVTSLLFSVDGASLYVGTEDGKLLLQTLRSTETPKIIAVGEQGCRVEGLAVTVLDLFASGVHRSHFYAEKEQALD